MATNLYGPGGLDPENGHVVPELPDALSEAKESAAPGLALRGHVSRAAPAPALRDG